ncbi:MAG: molybdopterin-synthase adenylyltransferase MoeB [Chloroflexi bacterium AL-W]|nr:molybdopterin-synthase adenylyltransferase MoeB [Chloroflexi bacterium AL-N1]NOK68891.1 molybdopterin-synthase adenylyltransferase MoeB [Chloroflexi bacterium AL-N10]NOK76874.1 molybdopterin-synthase adenylyltransferase MoeB [Chloroflexi bacterium AL-N5]NOK82738.1 molybdopterin-synthase adenylyltransferase MoeB [Chloroflexi bacterium AL-W]NOK90731.1 molybdopterin-synthase adenylyltransferase MoeB [Chloroflexi bacterium AL-N15]
MSHTALSNDEIRRYARHLILPEFGMAAQEQLKAGSVLLVGTGGLGSPLALYLAAAGVGHIGLVDFDVVEESNLQRQIVHGTSTLGIRKTDSAKQRLLDLNPHIEVSTYEVQLTSENALEILRPYDVIVDGTDNFPTRYLTNDASVLLGKPNVYGSIFRFEGQATVFNTAGGGPCYRCLYPEPPPPGLVPSCAEGGVLGVLPGIIGTLQATEVVKLLAGIGEALVGRLMLYDALAMQFRELKLRRNPDCPVCGEHPTITELIDYNQFCGIVPEPTPVVSANEITPGEVAAWLEHPDKPFLLDVREANEWDIGHLPDAIRISVNELAQRLHELDPERETVVYCRSGGRSARAMEMLQLAGFRKVKNMVGGILRWSDDVDPSIPKY